MPKLARDGFHLVAGPFTAWLISFKKQTKVLKGNINPNCDFISVYGDLRITDRFPVANCIIVISIFKGADSICPRIEVGKGKRAGSAHMLQIADDSTAGCTDKHFHLGHYGLCFA